MLNDWWSLRAVPPEAARLEAGGGEAGPVRVVPLADAAAPSDIQLNIQFAALRAGGEYHVTFLARAESPRVVGVGVARAEAPWSNLGFYRECQLSPSWAPFAWRFVASEDARLARVHFDVGMSRTPVEVSAVTVTSLADGRRLSPVYADAGGVPLEIPVGAVDFGSLRRLDPISLDWGWDRGLPIDRGYVETFLAGHRRDIRGDVLEIGDDSYTRRFGDASGVRRHVLHVDPTNPAATIVGDLSSAPHIPDESFDCLILTQTLQLIYDLEAAIATVARILRPGGVVLATVPGITQTYDPSWGDRWCWSFTETSVRSLFETGFPAAHVDVQAYGNLLAAVAFLQGLATRELTAEELEARTPGYVVTLGVRAVKLPATAPRATRTASAREVLSRAGVLMYHSIGHRTADPWALSVTPEHFSEHLDVLHRFGCVHPVEAFVQSAREGRPCAPGVALTFDDGYANNLAEACPRLEQHGFPATFFIATGYIGGTREFWWDELEALLLSPGTLPENLTLTLAGHRREWSLGDVRHYPDDAAARCGAWRMSQPVPTRRHQLYREIWELLFRAQPAEREPVLDQLRHWCGRSSAPRESHRPLTRDEITALARSPGATMGAHTVTHAVLTALDAAAQVLEIHDSRRHLEEILGARVTQFAYPLGGHDGAVVERIAAAGFRAACTTVPVPIGPEAHPLMLPRFTVGDWNGALFERRLKRWLQ
jgi:peptidoglycan/xylan/chitin deacetylase (PgdA/CDA1 family)/SAM-dependent methyltransferase